MKTVESLVDTVEAFTEPARPDDRTERIALLKHYRWTFGKEDGFFRKGSYRMHRSTVALLPLGDLEYSCAHPERVWPTPP